MDAQQELFIKIKTRIESQGYDVYDGELPPEGTAYPFVYIGENQMIDNGVKGGAVGRVSQTIHVYHNTSEKRGTLSNMLTVIKAICRSIDHTESNSWICQSISQEILPDNTTREPLLHGRITADYKY